MTVNNTTTLFASNDPVLAMALIFGILLIMIGFKDKIFWLLAGPCWILMGIAIFNTLDPAFMLMSVGLGIVLFFMGAMNVRR